MGADQLFYDPTYNQWIEACKFTSSNTLLDSQGNSIPCLSCIKIEDNFDAYDISIDASHIFFVGQAELVTHNLPFFA